jgi:hypothetical protein
MASGVGAVRRLAALIPGVVVMAGLAGPAAADVIVVQSNAPGLGAGQLLEDGANVTIPAGKQAVFVLPSGATRTVAGPFEGTAASLSGGAKTSSGVFDAVKRYVVTGGTSADGVGAVRSALPASVSNSVPFSWQLVPVTASGDICLLKNARIALARPRSGSTMSVTLVDTKQSRKVRTSFPADAERIPWPDELDLDAGATYALLLPEKSPRQIRVRVISEAPSRDETLMVLHRERCQSQFRAWLRELQQAGN